MNKVKKRAGCFIMSAALICAGCAMSACGSDKDSIDKEVLTLKWCIPNDDLDDLDEVMEEFNRQLYEKAGFELELEVIDPLVYEEKMSMKISTGEDFDLWFVGYLNKYHKMLANDYLYDLTDMLEASVLSDTMPQYVWDSVDCDGRIYAVPNFQVHFEKRCLRIRKDLAEKYNLDTSSITKTEDIEPFLQEIRDNEEGIYPFRLNMNEASFQNISNAYFSDSIYCCSLWVDDNGEVQCVPTYDMPQYRERVYKLYDWYKKGYIRQDIANVVNDNMDCKNMRYAVSVDHYKPGGVYEFKRAYDYEVIEIPISQAYVGIEATAATTIAINKNSRYPKEAFRLIELMNTDKELYNTLVFGLEGIHYKKIGADRITLLNKKHNISGWKVGNQFNAYFIEDQSSEDWEETKRLNEEANISPFMGFYPEMDEYREILVKLESINEKYDVRRFGAENPDNYWEDYRREMQEAGMERVCAEVKKQAQRFINENK